MGASTDGEVTQWLQRWGEGDPTALEQLTPIVYNQLRKIAGGLLHNERSNHTLRATALVHEMFQQLAGLRQVALRDRAHFFTFSARLMRRILIDYARRAKAEKRGMAYTQIPLNPELVWVEPQKEDTLDLASALDALEALDAQKARTVELRYFLGCSVPEIGELLNISPSSVDRGLRFSLAWLHSRLYPAG